MKLISFNIAVVLFTHIVSIIGTRIILKDMIAGGSIFRYYSQKSASASLSRSTYFSSMNTMAKKEKCLSSFDGISFLLASKSVTVDIADLQTEIEQNKTSVNFHFEETIDQLPSYVTIRIEYNQYDGDRESLELRGLPCMMKSGFLVAIVDVPDQNQFYVVRVKMVIPPVSGQFLALVEEATTMMDEEIGSNEDELEQSFQRSQTVVDSPENYRSICDLDSFNQFRACSSVYTVWEKNTVDVNVQNFVRKNENIKCLSADSIEFQNQNFSINSLFDPVEIDLIPCAVNTYATSPPFYLTMDQTEVGAVFVVTKINVGGSENKKYKLEMRVKNVLY